MDSLRSDGIEIDEKFYDLFEKDISTIPTDIQVMINNDEKGAALLRLVEVIGQENLPTEPCVIVSNHQGQWETYSMQYLFHPMCTLLKRELLYIPLWGWAMKMLNPIAINRSKPKEAILQTLEEGSNRLKNGMYVLLFPEGTRVEAGMVGKYARSSFELAKRNGVMVLPLCHNSGDCWPAHKFIKKPGKITLIIGEPFYVEDSKRSASDVRKWVEKKLNS